jgi:DNA polymerase III delta prime subunit
MSNYTFNTLSPLDFEILVRDLAQVELNIRFETFKAGKDKGIDFRYCSSKDHSIIIQCKHYLESGYKGLYKILEEEVGKAKKLAPERYILATSVALSVEQKSKILSLFSSFIKSPGDIWGCGDLNNLLVLHPQIEKHSFKLWMQSTAIIEEMLLSKIKNISREEISKIKNRTKHYVQNESFAESTKILDKHNFCIIAGIPGIGKTTLAEMLLLHYIKQGYEVVKITEDISEASEFDYTNQPRIFYYDDFLGQTSLADKLNKNEDQKLIDFVVAIKKSQVSKLILTTREYILNQARAIYEKLARTKFDTETCVVDLSKYNRKDKARILYNHIFFSDLPYSFKVNLLEKVRYLTIIDHKNYNPRIIDLMTSFRRVEHLDSALYYDYFIESLNNPLEIWRHAFENQISQESRNLLVVMASLPEEVFLEDLEEAFQSYHIKHSKEYAYSINPKDFKKALKELEGNFIKTEKPGDQIIVSFHNPSIADFVQHYLSDNRNELKMFTGSLIFFEQLMKLWIYYKLSESDSFEFINSAKKTINYKSCRLILLRYADNTTRKKRWELAYEERFGFFVGIIQKLTIGKCRGLYNFLYDELKQRINSGKSESRELVGLLIKLRKAKLIGLERDKDLLKNAKMMLLSKPGYFQQLEPICNFIENFPSFITDQDRQVGASYLNDLMNDYGMSDNDPDSIRQDAADVKYLGNVLSVEVDDFIEDIERHATSLEEEVNPYDYEDEHRDIDDGECDDSEIESMFNTFRT